MTAGMLGLLYSIMGDGFWEEILLGRTEGVLGFYIRDEPSFGVLGFCEDI